MERDPISAPGEWTFETLSAFAGEPKAFWSGLCEHARSKLGAGHFCFVMDGGQPGSEMQVLAQKPQGAAHRLVRAGLENAVRSVEETRLVSVAALAGFHFEAFALPRRDGVKIWGVADFPEGRGEANDPAAVKEIVALAELYQAKRREELAQKQFLDLAEVMDLGLVLGESTQFGEGALRICNAVAAQFGAARVSLGWVEGVRLRLYATSHGGKISPSSQEAESLVRVMEEAMDQDNEVAYPALQGSTTVSREARLFSLAHEAVSVLSVPFRNAEGVCGVLCVEKGSEDGLWDARAIERLRLTADLATPRLADLHGKTGWWGRKLWRASRRRLAGILGPEHTGWKLAGVITVVGVVALALIPMDHKVKAPFVLKTDAAARISAPFAGYIDEVTFHLGDAVKKGDLLVGLDRKELLLEEADTLAAVNKNERESRSFMAEGKLSQMQVALSDQRQAEAKLAIIRSRLSQTRILAPFDGVLVEGELRERLSAAVQAAEPLLKIVQLRDLFGQLQVDETDVPFLSAGLEGELAFASRPGEKYSVKLERLEPVAEAHQDGSTFVLRVRILGEPQSWWRPGMSGICKVNVGRRSVLWVISHRIVEVVRLWFWV